MKVQALIYPGMTLLDIVGPLQAWSFLPGYELQLVWRDTNPVPTDSGIAIPPTHTFETAWQTPDVLLVGGGAKPTLALLGDAATIQFVKDRGARATWVCSVCTGALVLGAAGLLAGYRATTHWSALDALGQFGAEVSDQRVCIDRNRATGGGITAGVDFGLRMMGHWLGDPQAKVVELLMEYAPQPPYGCGRPELADAATRESAQALVKAAMS